MVQIKQLVWDNWNVGHIRRHKVDTREVEEACRLALKTLKTYQGRLMILGKTKKGRLLTVVIAPISQNKHYVVTARDMSKKERRISNG